MMTLLIVALFPLKAGPTEVWLNRSIRHEWVPQAQGPGTTRVSEV